MDDLDAMTGSLRAGPSLVQAQSAGFPMGGETLAIDLADTLVTVTEPATDLLTDHAAAKRFWSLHAAELPAGWATPSLADTRALRDDVRALLDAVQQGTPLHESMLRAVNAAAGRAHASPHVVVRGGRAERIECWQGTSTDLPLAAAARSAIELATDPEQRASLRRCASPACSMLFVKGDARRRWCTPNICGNRDRAARHYRRHRKGDAAR